MKVKVRKISSIFLPNIFLLVYLGDQDLLFLWFLHPPVDQAGLELEIHLPLPPLYWD